MGKIVTEIFCSFLLVSQVKKALRLKIKNHATTSLGNTPTKCHFANILYLFQTQSPNFTMLLYTNPIFSKYKIL